MTVAHPINEGIFRDRRSPANAAAVKPVVCRRIRHFCENDTTPWWLKVNYLTAETVLGSLSRHSNPPR